MVASFDESRTKFQHLLESNGYPRDVVWIIADDLIVTGTRLMYVKPRDERRNEAEARMLFEQGTTQRRGVLFATVCVSDAETFCCAWVPRDEDQAQRALMPEGLKLAAAVNKIPAIRVRSSLHWRFLGFRYRKYQRLKNNLFWWED